MNLTKCIIAGLCITAMTASATVLKSDSFEDGTFQPVWSAPGDSIIAASTGVAEANSPIDTTDTKLVQLDTNGGVWTNSIEQTYESAPIYADMLVKFVPSEELPAVDSLVKLAIAVTNDVLVVTRADGIGGNEWIETGTTIDTSLWYRVTVKLEWLDPDTKAVVKIDGTAVSVDGNTTFSITDNDGFATLRSIGFQGTGFIDEVVVRDDDPFVGGSATLTLSFSTGIASVTVGGNQKYDTDTVPSDSELVITAAQWKEVAGITGPSTITWGDSAAGDSCVTVTVANATATTVTITAQTETSTDATAGTGTSFDGAPMNTVATWALANGVTELTNGIYDQYLFNIDDQATVPTLLITSISVSGSTVTVTVTAGTKDLTDINGTLKLKSYATLGGTPTEQSITFTGTTTATIVKDIGTDKFVKAAVE